MPLRSLAIPSLQLIVVRGTGDPVPLFGPSDIRRLFACSSTAKRACAPILHAGSTRGTTPCATLRQRHLASVLEERMHALSIRMAGVLERAEDKRGGADNA